MKIDVSKLREDITTFQKLLKEYEENYLNYYHELSSASFFWHDTKADAFLKSIDLEKLKIENFYEELSSLSQIYQFLIAEYKKFGNVIQFDLNMQDSVVSKFNLYFEKMDDIIRCYQKLDLSFCHDLYDKIRKEELNLIENKKLMESIFNKWKDYSYKIAEIEKQVNQNLSKLEIEVLQETEVTEFI